MQESPSTFRLGDWQVDVASGEIRRDDGATRRLEPRPMAVLVHLAESGGEVVSKKELLDTVWADACVGEDSVWRAIYGLRKALGEDAAEPRYVETVPKRGYRIVAPVTGSATAPATKSTTGTASGPASGPASGSARDDANQALDADPGPGSTRRSRPWRWIAATVLSAWALVISGTRQVEEAPGPAGGGIHFERLLGIDRSAASYLALGRRYYDGQTTARAYTDGDLDRAEALFEKAVRRNPAFAPARAELASVRCLQAVRAMWNRPALEEARQTALEAVELDPDLPEAHRALGMVEQKLGHLAAAQVAYEHAVRLRPDFPEVLEGLGVVYALRGHLLAALDVRRRLLDSGLEPGRMLGNLGWTLLLLGDLEESGRHFRAALDHEPFQVVATVGLAELDLRGGDPGSARGRLEEAVEVHPDSSALFAFLGELAVLEGRLEEARTILEKAVRLPGTAAPDAWTRLALVRQRLGEEEEARRLLEILEKSWLPWTHREGELYAPHLWLTGVYALQQRPDTALDHLEKAVDLGLVDFAPLRRDPILATLEGHPRFQALEQRARRRIPG